MKKVYIECPYCRTSNDFSDIYEDEFKCEDCWAILNPFGLKAENDTIKACIFCGSVHFYWEYPFLLPLFKKRLTCYVCEAEYIGFVINKDIRKYNEQTFGEIKNTSVYKDWKKFWKEYDPGKDNQSK